MAKLTLNPFMGGKAGEPVPAVDPDDLKTVWNINSELQAQHPGEQFATGIGAFIGACKPGADIAAVGYRASMLTLMSQFAADQVSEFIKDGVPTDPAFRAIAKVPMEWMGVGIVRQGPPFDMDAFLRLCRDGATG